MDLDRIEVVFALPDEQCIVEVGYVRGLTASEAVARSGLPERYPEIAAAPLVLGLYGARIALDHAVKPGDRIEICRPLKCDPRERRRQLWREGRAIGNH